MQQLLPLIPVTEDSINSQHINNTKSHYSAVIKTVYIFRFMNLLTYKPHPAPEPYNFQYAANDEYGNNQYRNEEQDKSGVIRGSYGYTDANGLYRVVDYVADDDGFRASIRTNEPGGLTEPHPTTGSVENPADVQLSAEPVPNNVRQQQEQYASAGGARYRAGGAGGQASGGNYGGGHQGGANYASTSSGFGGGNYGGGSGPITQQKLRSFSEKY
ncbi:structural constituent of cuticle-like protein [Sarcoptes scabiei]|uniref:Structural constituent of cuticle-like protein n=1 Tax=Sarcoptes scabiei TaxID=52283 RepID=A0A132AG57_SARSC|nr:structural constituent of cuticle-like protein [Sarcoptes scabiei]